MRGAKRGNILTISRKKTTVNINLPNAEKAGIKAEGKGQKGRGSEGFDCSMARLFDGSMVRLLVAQLLDDPIVQLL